MRRRLIFLDIDGVICCNSSGQLEPAKLAELQRIVRLTGAKIVLSTDWRRQPALKEKLLSALRRIGVDCVGATPQRAMYQPIRPTEITDWLKASGRGVTGWVAIDDRDLLNELGGAALSGHFVRTNPSTGLTSRLADRAVQLLTEESTLPGPTRAPQPLALGRGGSAAARDADGAAAIADAIRALQEGPGALNALQHPQQHPLHHSLQNSPPRPAEHHTTSAGGERRAAAERTPMRTPTLGAHAAPRAADYHPHPHHGVSASARSALRSDRSDLSATSALRSCYASPPVQPHATFSSLRSLSATAGALPPPQQQRQRGPQQARRPCSAPSKRGRGGATVAGGGGGGGGGAFGRELWTEGGATVTASGLFATGRPHSATQRHPLRNAHNKPWT